MKEMRLQLLTNFARTTKSNYLAIKFEFKEDTITLGDFFL